MVDSPLVSGMVRRTAIVAFVSALATVPVWLPTFPPMADLPQHAAQVSLLAQLGEPGFRFTQLFEINWFTPYLFGYLLIYALVPFVGIVLATKTVVALALVALPVATARLMRETGADPRWAVLTIPALYGFTYQWGFLNFLVAAPVGLAFLAVIVRHARRPTARTYLAVGLLLVALFFCHAMICVFFGFVAGIFVLSEVRGVRESAVRLSPLTAVVPVGLAWGLRTLENPLAQQPIAWDLGWFSTAQPYYHSLAEGWGWGRTAGLLPRLLGVRPGILPLTVGALLFVLPLLAGARPNRKWTVWLPFATCSAVLLFAPETLFGTNFTFQRFTVFVLPLYLAALSGPDRPGLRRPVAWLSTAVVIVWVAFVSRQTLAYQAEARGFDEVLERMEPGQRALSLVFLPNSAVGIAPAFLHYPAWYSAIGGGVVDPSFAWTHVELVLYRPEHRPVAGVFGFEWNPQAFDWRRFRGEEYRYFVVRAPTDVGPWLFRSAPRPPRLAHRAGPWWLYENSEGGAVRPSSR